MTEETKQLLKKDAITLGKVLLNILLFLITFPLFLVWFALQGQKKR